MCRELKRLGDGRSKNARGRPPMLTAADVCDLKKVVQRAAKSGDAFDKDTLVTELEKRAQTSLKGRNINPDRGCSLSRTTIRRYKRILDVITVKSPSTQNVRRQQV